LLFVQLMGGEYCLFIKDNYDVTIYVHSANVAFSVLDSLKTQQTA